MHLMCVNPASCSVFVFCLQEVSIWYEQGLAASADGTDPISGVTAVCQGADGAVAATLEVSRVLQDGRAVWSCGICMEHWLWQSYHSSPNGTLN